MKTCLLYTSELFDDAVERYNIGKRKDRQIANYYEKIRQGKQEKLFHEVIFQIGNHEDMAVGTLEGNLAVKVLDEYVKDFQKRNPTLRVLSCYLHQDEATPHLHIDFVPYVTNWKGKGMDTRFSLKQALKSLGFQGEMCIRDRGIIQGRIIFILASKKSADFLEAFFHAEKVAQKRPQAFLSHKL